MEIDPSADFAANCRNVPRGEEWLAEVPALIDRAMERWSLRVDGQDRLAQGTASVVLAVRRADDSPAVLKLGLPHMEAADEIQGLRFWNGTPTVHLLEADDDSGAMLLERCQPGTTLSSLPEEDQDEVIASLLLELWESGPETELQRTPRGVEPCGSPPGKQRQPDRRTFRPLSEMLAHWSEDVLRDAARRWDPRLVDDALTLFEELPRSAPRTVLLATDLHAGNVLRAGRRPWLVIDPKPFWGDPAYDVTQHLLNCGARMSADPSGTVSRMSRLAKLDESRVRLWMFARAATTSSEEPNVWQNVARGLAP
ncbi:MAG: hypothetical protein KDA27_28510 [Candidatus Eisenbacteria bacterium]|uniref:Kinase n=1 Tax=Eiseniibacteriota bacterium TaxID=2212470 RepID=A0A956SIN8_UNCEI|nr:hypothetical protein [Candidatus Eisenbacteria bacterium]